MERFCKKRPKTRVKLDKLKFRDKKEAQAELSQDYGEMVQDIPSFSSNCRPYPTTCAAGLTSPDKRRIARETLEVTARCAPFSTPTLNRNSELGLRRCIPTVIP